MLRKGIAFFLLSIFMLSATAPTVVSLIDENSDISFLIDVNEEESNEKESSKDSEIKIVELNTTNLSLYGLELFGLMNFYLKNYAKPYLNLLSPPPENNII